MVGDLIQSRHQFHGQVGNQSACFSACAQFSIIFFFENFMIVVPVFSHFWSGLVWSGQVCIAFVHIVEGSIVCELKFLHLIICNENTCKGLCFRVVYSSIHNNGFSQSEALMLLAFIYMFFVLLLLF